MVSKIGFLSPGQIIQKELFCSVIGYLTDMGQRTNFRDHFLKVILIFFSKTDLYLGPGINIEFFCRYLSTIPNMGHSGIYDLFVNLNFICFKLKKNSVLQNLKLLTALRTFQPPFLTGSIYCSHF